jgi:hypothetical protein
MHISSHISDWKLCKAETEGSALPVFDRKNCISGIRSTATTALDCSHPKTIPAALGGWLKQARQVLLEDFGGPALLQGNEIPLFHQEQLDQKQCINHFSYLY